MDESFVNAPDASKRFYFYLGLLSTKFAQSEVNIMSLLGKLVVDEVFLMNTIIERNSLSQNIELLKKINLYRKFEVAAMDEMIAKVSSLRTVRNLFIHSLWGSPYLDGEKLMISCLEPKIVSRINEYGRSWASAREHNFELSFLHEKVLELDSVLEMQIELLKKVETTTFL